MHDRTKNLHNCFLGDKIIKLSKQRALPSNINNIKILDRAHKNCGFRQLGNNFYAFGKQSGYFNFFLNNEIHSVCGL